MSKINALRAARQAMASGYHHHSYLSNLEIMEAVIKGSESIESMGVSLSTYADALAPTKLRGMKNGLICLTTVISRTAISNGVENELSFALSDYYINEVELQANEKQLIALQQEIVELYLGLIREEKNRAYSLPITRALRYIQLHLYDQCRVAALAHHVQLNPQYFASLFKKEVGVSPSRYISQKRLEEAQYLLRQAGMSVTEASEALGYCTPSHFIKEYRRHFGVTPKKHLS